MKKKKSNEKKKKKLIEIKQLIENLNKNNISISCITQFWGDEENRFSSIKEKINEFLLNDLDYDTTTAKKISKRLFEHWSFECEFNSTKKDINKNMTKEKFLWPISVFLLKDVHRDITDCLSFEYDTTLEDEIDSIFENSSMLFHERFEFSNRVIQDYCEFKNNLIPGTREPEKIFIKEFWKNYSDEFNQENYDVEKLEYVTKSFLYRIIINYRNLGKIKSRVGLNVC